jgi:hypothetical protein
VTSEDGLSFFWCVRVQYLWHNTVTLPKGTAQPHAGCARTHSTPSSTACIICLASTSRQHHTHCGISARRPHHTQPFTLLVAHFVLIPSIEGRHPKFNGPLRSRRTALRARRIHANTRTRTPHMTPQWTSSLPFFDCEKGSLGCVFFVACGTFLYSSNWRVFFCVRGPALFSHI